jgi:tetratricopeptide (TPR) repeat protein
MLKTNKIFLASSGELKEKREKIALFISQENKILVKQDVFMELVVWEELLHSFRGERTQDYFNEEMLKCDILIALFYKKVGQFTKEEFDIAYKNLKDGRNPKHMFVFFKEANITMSKITEDVMDVVKLKKGIEQAEQIYATFDSTQDLILQLKRQLEHVIQDQQASLEKHQKEFLDQPSKKTIEEIELEYNKISDELHPCFEANIDDLSWKIVERYADKIEKNLLKKYSNSKEKIISKLGLYSPINHSKKKLLHKSAVLCFHKSPETILPQARSVFVIGNKHDDKFIRRDVSGPLSEQIKKLIELIKEISFIDENGERRDIESIDSNLIRELISNAINHRDYNSSQNVQISLYNNKLEIQNPGQFPPNMSWEKLINSEVSLSHPINRRVSEYLRNLLLFEGIGRGFSIIKKYIEKNGPRSITFQEVHGSTTVISLIFKHSKHNESNKIIISLPHEDYLQLSKKLGVTENAVKNFFKIIEQKEVPSEDWDFTLRQIATRHKELLSKLDQFNVTVDTEIQELRFKIEEAVNEGNYDKADVYLDDIIERQMFVINNAQKELNNCKLSAAEYKKDKGDLELIRINYKAATKLFKEAVELVPDGNDLKKAEYLQKWGDTSLDAGLYPESQIALEQCLVIREKILPDNDTKIATTLNNLALLYDSQGKYEEAEPLYQRSLEIYEKAFGKDHPSVATTLNNLASLYNSQEEYEEAEHLFKRSLGIYEKAFGEVHPSVATTLNNLASLYNSQGKYGEAEPLYQRSLGIYEKALGKDNPEVMEPLNNKTQHYIGTTWNIQDTKSKLFYRQLLGSKNKTIGMALKEAKEKLVHV